MQLLHESESFRESIEEVLHLDEGDLFLDFVSILLLPLLFKGFSKDVFIDKLFTVLSKKRLG